MSKQSNFYVKKYKLIVYFFILVLLCAAFYSFATTPFNQDIKVFFASANQVKYQIGKGLDAIQSSWELKGLGNRILVYFVYSIANFIVGFENKLLFERCAFFIYGLMIVLCLLLTTILLPINKNEKRIFLIISLLSFFTANVGNIFQTEMTSVLLSLLSFGLIMHNKKWSLCLSGIVAASVFYYKSICVLLFIVVLVSIYLFDDQKTITKSSILISCASFLISLVLSLIFLYMKYPSEFIYMKETALFETTMLSQNSNLHLMDLLDSFLYNFNRTILGIPILLFSLISFLEVIYLYKENKLFIALYIICWVIPIDIIFVSNRFYLNHYFMLVYPCICSIILILRKVNLKELVKAIPILLCISFVLTVGCWVVRDGLKQISIINYSTLMMVQIHIILLYFIFRKLLKEKATLLISALIILESSFLWMNYTSFISPSYRNIVRHEKGAIAINDRMVPEDFGDNEVLYLDRGVAAFYFDAPSYRTYFFNLPLARWRAGNDWENQRVELAAVLAYKGKYIVLDDSYIQKSMYPQIYEKLENEYKIIEDNAYIYYPRWNPFVLSEIPSSPYLDQNSYLLVRIEE